MKNLFLIPTKDVSHLYKVNDKLHLEEYPHKTVNVGNQHLYIVSDEEIKKEDWVYHKILNLVFKIDLIEVSKEYIEKKINISKIILTTDQNLIKDGAKPITYNFLKWYIENSDCEFVNVNIDMLSLPLFDNIVEPKKIEFEEWNQDVFLEYCGIEIRKELPKYFSIRRDAENPLWAKYINWLNETYVKDFAGDVGHVYYGIFEEGYMCCINSRSTTVLTLEEWNNTVSFTQKSKIPTSYIVECKNKEETWTVLGYNNKTIYPLEFRAYYNFVWINNNRCSYHKTLDSITESESCTKYTFEEWQNIFQKYTIEDLKTNSDLLIYLDNEDEMKFLNNYLGNRFISKFYGKYLYNVTTGTYCLHSSKTCIGKYSPKSTILTIFDIKLPIIPMEKITVSITQVLQIHKIACEGWKPKIANYLARVDKDQNITFSEKEIDEMFAAATASQKEVLTSIFDKYRSKIKFDQLHQAQKIKINFPGLDIKPNEWCYLISKNSTTLTTELGEHKSVLFTDIRATEVFQNGRIFTINHKKDDTSFIIEVE